MNRSTLKLFCIMSIFSIGPQCNVNAQSKNPVDYVNPFLGTQFFGHMFSGPALPFAMVHLSPDLDTEGWDFCSGYNYNGNSIMGFSHTHWSGVGMSNGGEILLMPTVGDKLKTVPGSINHPGEGYRSRFSHADEVATPGYYAVQLLDCNVKAELTTTQRAGFHRYTFPKGINSRIILDLGHQISDSSLTDFAELKILNNNRIEGFKSAGLGKIYFVAEFSKSFAYFGTFDNDIKTPESGGSIWPYKNGEAGRSIGAFVTFKTADQEQILVKVGISYTGIEGARSNLHTEIPDWDFERIRNNAHKVWEKELSRIKIEGASADQKETFYSAMYHSLVGQYISQDVDGKYFGSDKKVHTAVGYDFYGSFSCWDTYRSQHPLLTLTAPDHVTDFLKSIVAKTRDYGWLPAQHFLNIYGEAMVGDHLIPVIVDAWMKGYHDFDVNFLYEAMRTKALKKPKPPIPSYAGRSGLEEYIKLGYAPYDKVTESVPNTLELAYDDWCIAQLAKELGHKEDNLLFMKRAHNYENLWDSKTHFMRPKNSEGKWLEALNGRKQEIVKAGDHYWYKYFDPLLLGERPNRHYTESTAWQYIWAVQHDVKGLINLFGGNKPFIAKLDTFFEMSPNITPPKYDGVVGTIGQYVQGNQPSHHVAYLYDYAGQPWKTQQRVRQICDELYRPGPGGICGEEDMGSLSSWYVLSAMGFYPVTPGSPNYAIGSPLFGNVTINCGSGKTFVIEARNNSHENKFIQSATLNGKPMNKTWLSHQEITSGGIVSFDMGPLPNKKWGSQPLDAPPSMSK